MPRRNYTRVRSTLHKGINQQPELVVPGEVADARNMWVRKGRLQTRPGYEGALVLEGGDLTTVLSNPVWVSEIGGVLTNYPAGFGSTVFSVGDRMYFGFTDDPANLLCLYRIAFELGGLKPHSLCEYYDGTNWKHLRHVYGGANYSGTDYPILSVGVFESLTGYSPLVNPGSSLVVNLVAPADWALAEFNSNTRYWLRWTVLGASATLISSAPRASIVSGSNPLSWAFAVRRALASAMLCGVSDGVDVTIRKLSSPSNPGFGWVETDVLARRPDIDAAPSYAFVQETETLYVALGGVVVAVPLEIETNQQEFDARVEDDETLVGERAAYSRDYIAQLSAYPEADRLLWARTRMWTAEGTRLRWSGPYPYHNVFPTFNTATVGEDDMSEITALASLGEHVVVFKRDSIYLAVAAGQTEFSTQRYAIVRVVSGVGCVSENSIQKIRGRLVFLGNDGVYVFDGTPNIRKATLGQARGDYAPPDRLCRYVNSLNWGNAHRAVSAHMRRWNCYVLAVPYGESKVNNELLVWDYDQNAWWIWDAIEAEHLIEGEVFGQAETLYFVNDRSQLFALGHGKYDHHQTISSYVTTREIALKGHTRLRLREVELLSDAESNTVNIEIRRHEDEVNTAAGDVDMTDATEPSWSDPPVDGVTEWASGGRRYGHLHFRVDGDQFNVKLSQSVAGQRFKISSMDVNLLPFPERR